MSMLASFATLFAIGLVLLAALVVLYGFGKVHLTAEERLRLLKRATLVSALFGLPMACLVFVGVMALGGIRPGILERLEASVAMSLMTWPFYAGFVVTAVFGTYAAGVEPARRCLWLWRVLSGLGIMLVNTIAAFFLLFFCAAAAGTYRGWN
jgi:hypothetical protein